MDNDSLENIAKQWLKISNKALTETYNNGKIVNLDDIKDINILKQSDHYTFIMMKRKTKNPSKIDLLIKEFRGFVKKQTKFNKLVIDRLDNIDDRLDNIDDRLDSVEDRLDNIVSKNNLLE